MQYTLRNIPTHLDRALREVAAKQLKSLNRVAIEALERGVGLTQEAIKYRDLGDFSGSWLEESEVDEALADQRRIDPDLWKTCD